MQRFAVLFVLVACGEPQKPVTPMDPGGSGSGSAPAPVADTDDAILEVVYLHEIAAASMKPDETICLRVRDAAGQTADASAALVTAVQKRHANAVPASACKGGGPTGAVRRIEPDGAAVMFDIGPVVRNAGAITVEGGGGHRGGMVIREVEYTIERTPQGLRVASERVLRES
jgi:hypothetical protein